jgi:hypothetical protein
MFKVKATQLNLRSEPRAVPSTRLAVLPRAQEVQLIEKTNDRWWRVRTRLGGLSVEGYVAASHLVQTQALPEPASFSGLVPVHLTSNEPVRRNSMQRRAFALNESGQPLRRGGSPDVRARELVSIVKWLGVDRGARYLARGGATYCNVYAYDYCHLADAYLPRVWWSASAVHALLGGDRVEAVYGKTVYEQNANALHRWLEEFGARFGWRRTLDLVALQDAANAGSVCLISAQRVEANLPGHICAVVPENGSFRAVRSATGAVTIPLQSNAGATNFQFGGKAWWTAAKFRSFGFYIHE